MISIEELIDPIKTYNPNADLAEIHKAYEYGLIAHEGQFRASGDPYFMHPIEVARIVVELRLDEATIKTALLHDTVEDTNSSLRQIEVNFGAEVAQLVDGVTKLTNLQLSSLETKHAENFRKLFVAMSKDLRVLLVKLSDRLHNMRTIRALPIQKQVRKARETMEIFAPLAGRMGMQSMREELEDLSFRVLNPEARNSIIRRFLTLRKETDDLIPKILGDINQQLEKEELNAHVTGREKKPYSIWRKMQDKKEGFTRLSDIFGFRIVTEKETDAYVAMGAVHRRWRAVPGRFKDYISHPKSNGYRSIHTTVSGRDGKRVEVQIRTREMHEVAESGVAAHWSYRNGERVENPFVVDPFKWLRRLSDGFIQSENPSDFFEHVKLEMFQDQVFCFTPKGEVIKLPRGATPIDFAYAIHTRIGDSCVGSIVDGQRVPLWTKLKNGQSVSIIRSAAQKPQSSWESMVFTGRAKSAIRRKLREEHRTENIKIGKEIARVSLKRIGKKATEKALKTAARKLALGDSDDVLAALGSVELTGDELIKLLYPEKVTGLSLPTLGKRQLSFIGLEPGQEANTASCCMPIPGERIVGIAVRGQGITIHAIDCDHLENLNDHHKHWIDLRWPEGDSQTSHPTCLTISMYNGMGVLGRICSLIGESGANITNIDFTDRKPDFYKIIIEMHVKDLKHLSDIMTSIETDSDISVVERTREIMNEVNQSESNMAST
ncbi:MAG: bifunctional (p)ppGpp synthetase/guanosine-3',5'-bis(diphosphate) 3'-pyrophosphohydrolase [Rhodobacteraceae bacterium]|nr:bifunctional (p)ppGpp synthetase/guanosine-3',5'-bis(diphosphate) 3'-pyrophosphohydrolase [Paracoccaceae bacterium]